MPDPDQCFIGAEIVIPEREFNLMLEKNETYVIRQTTGDNDDG
jgi:hypothetical protein